MLRYLANFGLLFVYLFIFWIAMKPSRKAKAMLFAFGFVAGAFSALWVDILYRLPYLNLRSYAHIVEELLKIIPILLLLSWGKTKNLLLSDKNSLVWFGAITGMYFAFLENIGWIQTLNIDLLTTIKRGLISWPMHMIYTGCSTFGLTQTLVHKKGFCCLLLLLVSILLHFLFNTYISPAIS